MKLIHKYYSLHHALDRYPSSYHAETFGILAAIMTCLNNSKIHIFTDSQNTIYIFDKFKDNNFNISIKNIFKYNSMTTLWLTIIKTIKKLNLKINLIKVKAHSGIMDNEKIDKAVALAHNDNYKYLVTSNNNFNNITYYPLWKNIPINTNLRKFLMTLSKEASLEKFLHLNRNSKYLSLDVDWASTFFLLNTDVDNTKTTFLVSKRKWQKVQLLIEELPTINQIKKSNMLLYEHMYCVKCEQFSEDFNHIFLCSVTSITIDDIITKAKNYLVISINNLIEENYFHMRMNEISNLDFWKNDFSNTSLTIIDIFKGIIPSILTNLIVKKVKTNKNVEKILISFREYILKYIRILWMDRCEQQHEKKISLGINKHLKNLLKNNLTRKTFTTNNIVDRLLFI